MLSEQVRKNAAKLVESLTKANLKLATAESCTGGLLSASITEVPGSSAAFERGFVCYSNECKIELLTVPTFFIEQFGAVSKEVAIAMAEGSLLLSKAQLSISITGIAGPSGATESKPVGTVFMGYADRQDQSIYKEFHFEGDRSSVRAKSVEAAINLLLEQLSA